jgi:ribonuclease R
MEFSIATLLAQFSGEKLVAPKALEKKLGCEDDQSIEKLQIVLDALEKVGVLVKERGRYRRLYEEGVVEAKLRCSSKGFCFAIQDAEQGEDIYIRESYLNHAWNGDRVLVKITKEGTRRRSPEGEVKLILDRANPSVLARIKQTERGFAAVPLDDRLLFELQLIANGQPLESSIEHLVHVEVVRYPIAQYPPMGKVARILGSDAEAADETEIVSCKHDLRRSFTSEALTAASAIAQVELGDTSNRLDLRQLLTLTLISQSALELGASPIIETAFTLEKSSEDHFLLGIHIADVAHYVLPETLLDHEARRRGTAVYLGTTLLPLFPDTVSQHCSLQVDADKLAISILLRIDSTGQLIEFEIQPSLIRVDRHLTYEEVQGIITSESHLELPEPVREMLGQLLTISTAIRGQRLERGSFELDLPNGKSHYPDEGQLGVITVGATAIASLLKELVILANHAVAAHLHALSLPAIYCLQKPPHPDDLDDLMKLTTNLGMTWKLEQEDEVRPLDFQNFTRLCQESEANTVLNYLIQSTLKPVTYSKTPGHHFGLGYSDPYTHCVSPLQRYGDLLVQRAIEQMFIHGRDRRSSNAKDSVNLRHSSCHGKISWNVLSPNLAEELDSQFTPAISQLNEREKIALDAESDYQGLKKAELMKERTGEVFQGIITGVQSYGFFVEIEDLLVEGLVHVSSLKDDWYEFRSRHACLVGRKNGTAYRLGDRVEVQVKSVDYYRQQIDLVTVGGGSEANGDDLEVEE